MFKLSPALIIASLLATGASSHAQCELLLRESFRPGERPHGGNGRLRDAGIHDTLKDYWPQVGPPGAMWISAEGNGSYWQFALSQDNPHEIEPPDPTGGVAWGWPGAVALIPFQAPTTAFRTSMEAAFFGGTLCTGFTTSAVLAENFETNGSLWISVNEDGLWTIYANGSQVVASGTASPAGSFNTGYLHIEFTYDPATSMVSGRAMNAEIPPTHVVLERPLTYFGIESRSPNGLMVDDVTISTGDLLSAGAPALTDTCDGGVDGDDVIAFFEQWDAGGAGADFTRDGGVDGDDVIGFFERLSLIHI